MDAESGKRFLQQCFYCFFSYNYRTRVQIYVVFEAKTKFFAKKFAKWLPRVAEEGFDIGSSDGLAVDLAEAFHQ